MRLNKIKLAGFKSFVDPTTLHLPGNLSGIVGPNGCGKSNVIDAVRWVMGESSAKSLRGESMADVIFNGSSARKPVQQAVIELVFDNHAGTLGGQYAGYSEIAIKRQVSRDGQSNYALNGTRCRRRDITDIFLGTGLGPHSYAIIEQNMITRLIEAKPDELRIFLEEAAGISKYKERRRETEARMRETRDNLARLNDIRDELQLQLERLQRQANVAAKFKLLKQQERQFKAELLAYRWGELQREASAQDMRIAEQGGELVRTLADQRALETAREALRAGQTAANSAFNSVQERFYSVRAELERCRDALAQCKERRRVLQQEQAQAQTAWDAMQVQLASDQYQLAATRHELKQASRAGDGVECARLQSMQAVTHAENDMQAGQSLWDAFIQRASLPAQAGQIQQTRIQHLGSQLQQFEARQARLTSEQNTLSPTALQQNIDTLTTQQGQHEGHVKSLEESLAELASRTAELRQQNQANATQLATCRSASDTQAGRLASLAALQESALGKHEGVLTGWLREQGLQKAPRLAQQLEVEPGWETAVECVLGAHLEAVCSEQFWQLAQRLAGLKAAVSLFDTRTRALKSATDHGTARLQDKVRCAWYIDALFAGVFIAQTLEEALALSEHLAAHESVVTPQGIWLGHGWLRVRHAGDEKLGVLGREQEIRQLGDALEKSGAELATLKLEAEQGVKRLHELEQERDGTQARLRQTQRLQGEISAQLTGKQARLETLQIRARAIEGELAELLGQMSRAQDELLTARALLDSATAASAELVQEKLLLGQQRDAHRSALDAARSMARTAQDAAHQTALQIQALQNALSAIEQRLARAEHQCEQLAERRAQLAADLIASEAPLQAQQAKQEQELARHVQIESELACAREQVSALEQQWRALDQQRQLAERATEDCRARLERSRLEGQALVLRTQTLSDQLQEAGFEAQVLLEELKLKLQTRPDTAALEQEWQAQLDQLAQKIARLGEPNFAALDDFAKQSERKVYLDTQFADLSEALDTLEEAIGKIDRETRTRFQQTFDRLNAGVQAMFPRLFGGGHAYLELSGGDLLNTGVTIMARPPGKANRTLQSLSGGEKALTAVALVFAIFELNPAPFCMLDEVDASLDEANVGRFCELLRAMSERIQFIFITHNKGTMEIAQQLTGITMFEPGVSRLVTVDIDEAAALVAL